MRNKKQNQKQNNNQNDGIDDDMVNALVDKILENPEAKDKLLRSIAHGVGRRALMAGAGGVLAGMAGMGSAGGSTFVTEDGTVTDSDSSDGDTVRPMGSYSAIVFKEDGEVVAEDGKGDQIARGIDDADVIQGAIDFLPENKGTGDNWMGSGKILLKGGTYEISSTINLPNTKQGVIMEGESWESVLKLANGANCDIIQMEDNSKIHKIKNLKIDGNRENNTSGNGIVSGEHCFGFIIEEVMIWQTKGHAIYLPGAYNYWILNCTIREPEGDGIRIEDTASTHPSHVKIYGLEFRGKDNYSFGGKGIYQRDVYDKGCDQIRVRDCEINYSKEQGILIERSAMGILDSNYLEHSNGNGIETNHPSKHWFPRITITNNRIYDAQSDAIHLATGFIFNMTGNLITNSTGGDLYVDTNVDQLYEGYNHLTGTITRNHNAVFYHGRRDFTTYSTDIIIRWHRCPDIILFDASGGNRTITLPDPSSEHRKPLTIKKIDSTSNKVTVNQSDAEKIDGVNRYDLTVQYETVTIISDGTNWFTV